MIQTNGASLPIWRGYHYIKNGFFVYCVFCKKKRVYRKMGSLISKKIGSLLSSIPPSPHLSLSISSATNNPTPQPEKMFWNMTSLSECSPTSTL
jgi:hypothetical protein